MHILNLKKVYVLFAVLLLIYAIYKIIFIDRVLPNVYFAGQNLTGKELASVESYVENKIQKFEETSLVIEFEGKSVQMSFRDLGVGFNHKETADAISQFGRSDLLTKNFFESIAAPFKKTNILPRYEVDYAKLTQALTVSLAPYESRANDATIVYKNGNFQIRDAQAGKLVNRSQLLSQLKERLETLSGSLISVSLYEESPVIKSAQAQKAYDRVLQLNKQKIILKYDQDSWNLSGNELINILEFAPKGFEEGYLSKLRLTGNPVIIERIDYKNMQGAVLTVRLNTQKLKDFIGGITLIIDRPTQDAQIEFSQDKVVRFVAARNGQKLDADLTYRQILEKVSIDNPNLEKDIIINLPVAVTHAKIANDEVNSLGIRELIGKGVSYFAGSISNRVYNIGLGAQRINGTIVKPGEVFSFNQAVGEVSGKTGFRQAYVISKGRTVLDDGGGICQVSTTVFRAALNSGLPILERTAHAYRVAYYEQRGVKPGMDATVWAPAVDLKFKNDTDKHILVQTVFDSANLKLEVDVYGTNDGRTVEISTPFVSNVKPPPADLYQDDPTLPKGITKQVDFAAWGATAVFTRKVYKQDKLIIEDAFKSNFRPWQAIYLVGTGG